MMSEIPFYRLRPALRAEVIPGEAVFLLWEDGSYVLTGALCEQLVPLLEQGLSWDALRLHFPLTPPSVLLETLQALHRAGLLLSEASAGEEDVFWDRVLVSGSEARARLQRFPISLKVLSPSHAPELAHFLEQTAGALQQQLERLHIPVQDLGLPVVLVADVLDPRLEPLHLESLKTGRPWLLVRPCGTTLWLGPLFVPGSSGCWRCLTQRVEGHRKVEHYLAQRLQRTPAVAPAAFLPSLSGFVAGTLSTLLARAAVEGTLPALEGHVLAYETLSMSSSTHRLVRRPQCHACGDPGLLAQQQHQPVVLETTLTVASREGGLRQLLPERLVERLQHHVSPITGVIRRLERASFPSDDPSLLHTYITDHNFVHACSGLQGLRGTLRAYSGGKGRTDAQARASAIGESLERYAAAFRGDEARIITTLNALGDEGIDPREVLHFSPQQYAERSRWNQTGELICRVPAPFQPDKSRSWTPCWSLTKGARRYLPTELCFYGFEEPGQEPIAYADSNGTAAGLTRAEAILQGFLELVERDAAALWWYNRVSRPRLNLERMADPWIQQLVRHWQQRGRRLWALDLQTDLHIPVVVALSAHLSGGPQGIIMGLGCHFDPQVALIRALTEHNQFMPWVEQSLTSPHPGHSLAQQWLRDARLEEHPWLAGHDAPSTEPVNAPTRVEPPEKQGLESLLAEALRRTAALGLELLALDCTQPDVELAVVRVVVPGLRHFWPRLGPGRLYHVPVKLGWLPHPPLEATMNPMPIFI